MKLIDYLETLQIEYFEKIHSQFESMVCENLEEDFSPDFEGEGWSETLCYVTQNLPVNLHEQEEFLEKLAIEMAELADEEYRFKLEQNQE